MNDLDRNFITSKKECRAAVRRFAKIENCSHIRLVRWVKNDDGSFSIWDIIEQKADIFRKKRYPYSSFLDQMICEWENMYTTIYGIADDDEVIL